MSQPRLTAPGAYRGISNADYHRNPNLLPEPSLSSSGCKTILNKSAFHFWWDSPMNPNRPPETSSPALNVGKAAHDMVLLSERWTEHYYVLPKGFSRAATVKQADAIAEADAAIESGLTVLSHDEAETVRAVANAIKGNSLAVASLTAGEPEETLVWQDPRTGVWLRVRPDFRPDSILVKRPVMVVPDLKFMASTYATPEGFGRAIHQFGYHQSAALYADGIKAIYGHYPTHWLHVVVEKEPPHCVALYQLPGEDIELGRVLNRRAIDQFARCLDTGKWPGYADEPTQVGLPVWSKMKIDALDPNEFALADAA